MCSKATFVFHDNVSVLHGYVIVLHGNISVFMFTSVCYMVTLACNICYPYILQCISFFSYSWRLGEFLCKFVNYLQNLSIICSVMTLTGLSLER